MINVFAYLLDILIESSLLNHEHFVARTWILVRIKNRGAEPIQPLPPIAGTNSRDIN